MESNLYFGDAIKIMIDGGFVAREGWNGKGMYLYVLDDLESQESMPNVKMEPCIVMRTAQGLHQPGWLASQADMLANDWCEVDTEFSERYSYPKPEPEK